LVHSSTLQLALNITLQDGLSFDNFYTTSASEALVDALQHFSLTDRFQSIGVWGSAGSGRSHLLQATVQRAESLAISALYLPGEELIAMDPTGLLQGLDEYQLIAIDDIDRLVGDLAWEHALFEFYNRLHDRGHLLLFASHAPTSELSITLADLASRLAWGAIYHLPTLDDEQKLAALQLRAHSRGMLMGDDVGRYIMARSARNFPQLIDVLNQLDKASIKAQRKLTVPFVKQVCGW